MTLEEKEPRYLPESENKSASQSISESVENRVVKKDGLDFKCEVCMDRDGGCSQCGFGRVSKES